MTIYDKKSPLESAVLTRFGSISAMARTTGWSYTTTYRIVTEARDLTQTEMRDLIRLLGLTDPAEIVRLFGLLGEEHTT